MDKKENDIPGQGSSEEITILANKANYIFGVYFTLVFRGHVFANENLGESAIIGKVSITGVGKQWGLNTFLLYTIIRDDAWIYL